MIYISTDITFVPIVNLAETLDQVLQRAADGELEPGPYFARLTTSQPDIFTYFFDEDTRLLSEQEHDYLLFVAMILIEALGLESEAINLVHLDDLEQLTERNWGMIEFTSIENLTATFAQHPWAVLYEFLEDACTPEQGHDVLTEGGTSLVFVKLKTLLDALFPA